MISIKTFLAKLQEVALCVLRSNSSDILLYMSIMKLMHRETGYIQDTESFNEGLFSMYASSHLPWRFCTNFQIPSLEEACLKVKIKFWHQSCEPFPHERVISC